MQKFIKSIGIACLLATSVSSNAALVTFFGEDPSTSGVFGPNSQAARDDFLSNLSGVGNESFESFSTGASSPLNLVFPGSAGNLTASLSGNVTIAGSGPGRFPTSGSNFLEASTGSFTIDFGSPVSTFGFNGIDIGDFVNAQMTLNLVGGTTQELTVPHSLNIGNNDQATLFFGFIDDTATYSSISFNNVGGGDLFAFDDMVIGDVNQIVVEPTAVPELSATSAPLAIALMSCLLGLGVERRRRKLS